MANCDFTRSKTCQHCGELYTGSGRKYCSMSCNQAAYRVRKTHDPRGHKCHECGERFTGRKRKYCSEGCAHEAHARQTRIARNGNPERKYRRPRRIEGYPAHVRTEAERRRWRYHNDQEYRAKELARHYRVKAERRLNRKLTDDGTVGPGVLTERTRCLYCDCRLTGKNRTLDHMIPLHLGGEHSAANVTPCCLSCNSRKQARPFDEWLDCLDEPHRSKALCEYVRKRGSHPRQSHLQLAVR